ncbi:hrpJ-like domain protein, partial [Vibrio parahaemolyticus V-223/04]
SSHHLAPKKQKKISPNAR